jgi:hypothetical protein
MTTSNTKKFATFTQEVAELRDIISADAALEDQKNLGCKITALATEYLWSTTN